MKQIRLTPEDEIAMQTSGISREAFEAARRKELDEKERRAALRRGGYGDAEAATRVDVLIAAKVFPETMRAYAVGAAKMDRLAFEKWAAGRIGR